MKPEQFTSQPMLTISVLSDPLQTIMSAHIGHRNSITRAEMFKKLFGHKQRPNDLADYFRSITLSKVCTALKKHSFCFICKHKTKEGHEYFVAKTSSDVKIHKQYTDKRKKGLDHLHARCEKAVAEKWYKKL